MPCNYKDYNPDFSLVSNRVRFEREGGQCQECGKLHGSFYDGGPDPKSEGPATLLKKVVLTTAHLDHNPQNDTDENLRALCGACHLYYDRFDNAFRRKFGKYMHKVQLPIQFK